MPAVGQYDFFVGVAAAKIVLGALWLSPRLRNLSLLGAASVICLVLARAGVAGLIARELVLMNAVTMRIDLAHGFIAGALLMAIAKGLFRGRIVV
jgi:hypothetical protein